MNFKQKNYFDFVHFDSHVEFKESSSHIVLYAFSCKCSNAIKREGEIHFKCSEITLLSYLHVRPYVTPFCHLWCHLVIIWPYILGLPLVMSFHLVPHLPWLVDLAEDNCVIHTDRQTTSSYIYMTISKLSVVL